MRRFSVQVVCSLIALLAASPVVDAPANVPPAPDAITAAPTDITTASATFAATVNPHGLPTTVHFDYGTTPEYGQRTPDVSVGAGITTIPFTAPVAGLAPRTRYYYRVYAVNSAGFEAGDIAQLLTVAVERPKVTVLPVTDVTQTSLTVNATVLAGGAPATVTMRYAPVTAPLNDSSWLSAGPVTVDHDGPVSFSLTGLAPDAAYRYRLSAQNSRGSDFAIGSARTAPLLRVPRLVADAPAVAFGSTASVRGELPGHPGLTVALQRQAFPYDLPFAPFGSTATTVTDGDGQFRFGVALTATTRFGIRADGFVLPSAANWITVRVMPDVRVSLLRAGGHRFRVIGRYAPDVAASVSLYRVGAGRSGAPVTARRKGSGRTFAFAARRLRRGTYQVRVTVTDRRSGLVGAISSPLRVPRR
jgi:hypothetical protein